MEADTEVHSAAKLGMYKIQLLEVVPGKSKLIDLDIGGPGRPGPLTEFVEAGLVHVDKQEGDAGVDAGKGKAEVTTDLVSRPCPESTLTMLSTCCLFLIALSTVRSENVSRKSS